MREFGKNLRAALCTAGCLLCLYPPMSEARDLTREAQRSLYEAQQALEGKNYTQAREVASRYIEKNRANIHPLAYEILGSAWYAEGRLQESYDAFKKGVELAPRSLELCSNLATVAYDLADFQQAAALFENAYELSKKSDGELLYRAAAAFAKAGNQREAHRTLRQLADRKEAMQQSWLQLLIHTDLDLEAWKDADQDLSAYLERFNTEAAYWRLLGQVHMKQKDYPAAAGALEIAYVLDPPSSSGWRELADLYLVSGVPLQAARCLERAWGPEPTPAQCDLLAGTYSRSHQLNRAVHFLDSAIARDPSALRYLELGKLYYEAGFYEKAVGALSASIGLQQDNGLAHLLVGYSCIELGRLEAARLAFGQAAEDAAYRERAEQSLRALEF